MSTLSEAQINAITYRIYEENEFGASMAMQGQIMNRQNWRNYEQALLDTLVDRIGNYDMSGIDPNYTAEQKLAAWMTVLPNDPNTGVITCQISRASFEQWMAANYDVDTSIAPQAGIYDSNDQCIIRGSQGYIEDDINVYNIHSIDDSTFYVSLRRHTLRIAPLTDTAMLLYTWMIWMISISPSGSLAGIRSRFPSNLLQPIKIKGV